MGERIWTPKGEALWKTIQGGENRLCLGMNSCDFYRDGRTVSDLWDFLGADRHPMLRGLMLSSGIDETYIGGKASAYDKAYALAEVLPRWAGNPYYAAIHDLLEKIFFCSVPLNTETLPDIWQKVAYQLAAEDMSISAVVKAYGFTRVLYPASGMPQVPLGGEPCLFHNITPVISPYHPAFADMLMEMSSLSAQTAVSAIEEIAHGEMQDAAAQGGVYYVTDVSAMTDFPRPHPYPAGQVCQKLSCKEEVSDSERDLLLAQMLRYVADNMSAHEGTLVLEGIRPAVYERMLVYLKDQKIGHLPLCVTQCPEDAVSLIRLGAKVALTLELTSTELQIEDAINRVAAGAPIGCLAGLCLSAKGIVDLPLIYRIEKLFCGCIAAWGERGLGPADQGSMSAVAEGVLRPVLRR